MASDVMKKSLPRIRQPRTPLALRKIPVYTKGEEIFNMVTHILGGGFGIVALTMCMTSAIMHRNWWGLVTGIFYCISMILVYVVSSIYHGLSPLKNLKEKKIMQVLDHCDIYGLVSGTYLPIAMTGLRESHPVLAWTTLGIVYGVCILGTVFTAIDFHKFGPISYACYFVAGWSVLAALPAIIHVYSALFAILLFVGGVAYSSGMIFFVLQRKHKYQHSVFHIFIILGSVLQFVPIFLYCM